MPANGRWPGAFPVKPIYSRKAASCFRSAPGFPLPESRYAATPPAALFRVRCPRTLLPARLLGRLPTGQFCCALRFFLHLGQAANNAQLQLPRHQDQMFFADQMRAQFRELALTEIWKAMKQFFGRNQPQDGVSQELQLLVVS